ncbi:TPA: FkbM family methyltransferase [Escherichia coli]|nr:FkbM family methyltransferase [Escherichia coli]
MPELKIPQDNIQPISVWLDVLGTVFSPQGLLLIGAGSGNSQWIQWLLRQAQFPILLVEGDKVKYKHLERSLRFNEDWTLQHEVVAQRPGPIEFHHASNPNESGLLPPAQLNSFWSNLECVGTEHVEHAVTLSSLLESQKNTNWLVLDCLPAATILMGAGPRLSDFDVIIVRVTFNNHLNTESGGDHNSIDILLQSVGLTCVNVVPQRNPALAHAIYVRDIKKQKIERAQNKENINQLKLMLQQAEVNGNKELELAFKSVESLQKELNESSTELNKLKENNHQSENKLSLQSNILKQTEERFKQSQQELNHKSNELKKDHKLITELETQLAKCNAELISMQKCNERLQQQLDLQNNKISELKDKLIASQLATEHLQVTSENTLQSEKQRLEHKLTEQNKELKSAKEALAEAKKILEKIKAEHERQKIDTDHSINLLNCQVEKQKTKIDELKKNQEVTSTVQIKKNNTTGFDDFIDDIEPYLYGKSITYVDVGAFVGDVYKFIIDNKKIRVREAHLIEPNPESYEKLISNITKYRIPVLHTYNIGISYAEQTLRFSTAASMTKAVTTSQSLIRSEDCRDIKCSPLDELSQFITDGKINLLKIDVEGHEMSVLKGAESMLQKGNIDIIYIEVGFNIAGTQQSYFAEVDQLLQKYNYRCFKIYEQTHEWIHDHPWLRRCNFAYFSAPFAINNPAKLTLENRRLQQLLENKIKT